MYTKYTFCHTTLSFVDKVAGFYCFEINQAAIMLLKDVELRL